MTVWTMMALALFSSAADADIDAQEQAAQRAAVERVAPAVVQIETIGGLDRAGPVRFGAGPTTGLLVDPAGYVVSSAWNFAHRPSSILVRMSDGSRRPAALVAADHSRMLVLLKTDPPTGAISEAAVEAVPKDQMRVGQWAIAVGRAFDPQEPNRSVGILSALDRVWGKAIQTDAAVSPNNYGGPLVDIHGRVLGVLAPLAPDGDDQMAGVAWYDSGIGFAVPLEDILRVLPRLKRGEDLYPGWAGIQLPGPNLYTGASVIAQCEDKSPAARAGLKPGDRITAIDGRAIRRAADLRQQIGRRYAGEKMRVTLERDRQRLELDLELARPPAS